MRTLFKLFMMGLLFLIVSPLPAQDLDLWPVVIVERQTLEELGSYMLDLHTGEKRYDIMASEIGCPNGISPDGQWVLYDVGMSPLGNRELLNLETREVIPLPSLGSFAWSANGRFLAYLTSWAEAERRVSVYDRVTGAEELVETLHQENFSDFVFQWVDETLWYAFRFEAKLYLQRVDTGELTQQIIPLPDNLDDYGSLVSISPDGRYLTVRRGDRYYLEADSRQPSQLWVFDLITHEWLMVSAPETGGYQPAWSPDGHYLAFVTAVAPQGTSVDLFGDIYLWNTANQTLNLFNDSLYGSSRDLLWSPDGHYLAYRDYHAGGTHNESYTLYVKGLDADHSQEIQNFVDVWSGDMAWISPTELVYLYANSELSLDDPKKQIDLYRYDVIKSKTSPVTETPDSEFFSCVYG